MFFREYIFLFGISHLVDLVSHDPDSPVHSLMSIENFEHIFERNIVLLCKRPLSNNYLEHSQHEIRPFAQT
jgi:hypothetical protein